MTEHEQFELESRLRATKSLKMSIDSLKKITDNIWAGECVNIEFNYKGASKGLPFQMDYEGEGSYTYIQEINKKTLNVSKEKFDSWFSKQLINYLGELKKELEEEYKNQ